MKFGVKVTTNFEEDVKFDSEDGATFWAYFIKRDVENYNTTFNILEHDSNLPPCHKYILFHFVFHVKFGGARKA